MTFSVRRASPAAVVGGMARRHANRSRIDRYSRDGRRGRAVSMRHLCLLDHPRAHGLCQRPGRRARVAPARTRPRANGEDRAAILWMRAEMPLTMLPAAVRVGSDMASARARWK